MKRKQFSVKKYNFALKNHDFHLKKSHGFSVQSPSQNFVTMTILVNRGAESDLILRSRSRK